MSDALDLDAIEARVNAATQGPWTLVSEAAEEYYGDWTKIVGSGLDEWGDPEPVALLLDDSAAEFLAHVREDVPALIARIRQLDKGGSNDA